MSVAVITSIYGGYDQPVTQPTQTLDAEWICVTDREGAESFDGCTWKIVTEQRPHMHPRLAAKVAKCLPGLYTDAETVVWIDGACRLLRPDSLAQIVAGAKGALISQVVHPWRRCIYDEAVASSGMPKYEMQSIQQQVDHYRVEGHPAVWGLWATGLIVRCHAAGSSDREVMRDFGLRWLAEQMRWTYQDQLSEAPILRQTGVAVHPLPFSLHGNGVFEWLNHAHER